MGKVKKNLGLGKLIAAAFFLFNPNIVIVDILPDFIGYLLLLWGISQLADLNHHFEEASKLFWRMFAVSLGQFFSIFVVFGVLPAREQSSALMLVCFAFGALELVLLIPAFKAFFDGFIYLGSRHESTAVFARRNGKKNKGMTATAKTSFITVLFIILKPVLTFAPEILALFDNTIDPNLHVNFYRYVESFRIISLVFLIPLGIIWLVSFIKYISSVTNDKPFIDELSKKYTEEITPKTHIFIERYIKLAFVVLGLALIFNIDFYIDDASILPDFISPIILLISFLIIKKVEKASVCSHIFTIGYMISSAVSYWLHVYFFKNYTLTLTYIDPDAYNTLQALTVAKAVDSVFFAGMIISLLPLLMKIITKNTGYLPQSTANYNAEEKARFIHTMLKNRLTVIAILSVIAAASSISYVLLLRTFVYSWLIEFVIYIAFTVYFIVTLNHIQEEMEYKYMLS